MKIYSLRLNPGQDLRVELVNFAKHNGIRAGSILTCVGSLKSVILRLAGATVENQNVRTYEDVYEIVSLVGTLTGDDCHIHISVSDKNGVVIGGHLKEGSLVDTTAEIVITEHEGVEYLRELDNNTGFPELVVRRI
ncbi:DNA-binding protein [Candidatus Saccharibacteria bacterium]|nr:DNA-binding protein [Candidatus Saccharibacteria bacterium]